MNMFSWFRSFHQVCTSLYKEHKSAKSAADKLNNNYMLTYRYPRQVPYDRGKEFRNSLFPQLHQLCKIKSTKITPYYLIRKR